MPVVHLINKVLSLLLFADDIALVARSKSELQTLLDLTAEYLEEKKLKINTKMTEVLIFRHRQSTGTKDEESFNLKGEAVKVVSQARCLRFHLTSKGVGAIMFRRWQIEEKQQWQRCSGTVI